MTHRGDRFARHADEEPSGVGVAVRIKVASSPSGVNAGSSAKITVRIALHIAGRMAAQARAAGLLHGVYLSTLISGAPAVLTGTDHRRAMNVLTASNDEIARMATNVNGLIRLLRREEVPCDKELAETLDELSLELRAHLRYASWLIADLAPFAVLRHVGPVERPAPGGGGGDRP